MCGWVAQSEGDNDEAFEEAVRRISHRGTRVTIKEGCGGRIAHAAIRHRTIRKIRPACSDEWTDGASRRGPGLQG